MFGKLGDMMEKLQVMKQRAEDIKQKLNNITIKSGLDDGGIQIEITGNREIKKLNINPSLLNKEKKELESLLLKAVNSAIAEASKHNEEEMKKAAMGLMPGL